MDKTLKVTRRQLASIFGIAQQTVVNYEAEGMPYTIEGGVYEYYLPEVFKWHANRRNSTQQQMDEEKLRKLTLEADKLQLEKDIAEGRAVFIEDICDVVTKEFSTVRAKLLSLPTKCTPKIHISQNEAEIEKVLTKEVREILTELTLDQGTDADIIDRIKTS